jgi:hypothetical protein
MKAFQQNSKLSLEEGNFGMMSQIMEGLYFVITVTQSNMPNTRKDYDDICLQGNTVSVE